MDRWVSFSLDPANQSIKWLLAKTIPVWIKGGEVSYMWEPLLAHVNIKEVGITMLQEELDDVMGDMPLELEVGPGMI